MTTEEIKALLAEHTKQIGYLLETVLHLQNKVDFLEQVFKNFIDKEFIFYDGK